MTPIFDQLLKEYIEREDSTFEQVPEATSMEEILSDGCKRYFITYSPTIRQKEVVSCPRPQLAYSIHTSETPSPA